MNHVVLLDSQVFPFLRRRLFGGGCVFCLPCRMIVRRCVHLRPPPVPSTPPHTHTCESATQTGAEITLHVGDAVGCFFALGGKERQTNERESRCGKCQRGFFSLHHSLVPESINVLCLHPDSFFCLNQNTASVSKKSRHLKILHIWIIGNQPDPPDGPLTVDSFHTSIWSRVHQK